MPNDNHTDDAPDDVNYPNTLRITIETTDEAFDAAIEDAGTADDDEQSPAVVSFADTKGVRRLLTDRRLEILRSLMREPAPSITALAERLDRSYAVVHDDVSVLAEYGIVQFREDGTSKQPFVPYETVEFDVTVQAEPARDTEAPA